MNKIFVLFFLFAWSQICYAQKQVSITGTIRGASGPLPGATVSVKNSTTGAVADSLGHYKLEISCTDSLRLEFRSIGFRPTKKNLLPEEGKNMKVDIFLEENELGLDEVVVSGTMKPVFITASPIKVEVVTSRYMHTFLPAAASSIVEGVKLVNGVQEVVECGVCFTNNISINGLPGPYTAVLIDGTPLYGNLASVYGLNGIPSMIIDRFEVIKGPSSTLYGSEAVAGVINIITKDPEKQPLLSLDLMGTSLLESFGNLSAAPSIGKSSGFVGLNYGLIRNFTDRNKDGFNDLVNMDRLSLFSKWNIYRKSGRKWTLAGKYYYEDRRNGVKEYVENQGYRRLRGSKSVYGESIFTHRAELFGSYEVPLAESVRIDYSLSRHRQDSYYGADFYEAEQQLAFTNFIWDKSLNLHDLLIGLTARYQYYDDNTVATADTASDGTAVNKADRQYIPGLFVQDEWSMSKRFTLLSGARLDYYSAHGPIFSPRLNLKYKPGDWTSLRGNFGTGFRIVNLFTEDHAFVSGQRSVEITEELKPERSYNATLNLNYVFSLGNSQGTIDIDAFYTYFTNKIIPDYEQPGKIIYANTSGHAVSKGIGLNVMQEFGFPLSLNLGVTLQQATETEKDSEGQFSRRFIEFAPRWSGVFTASYQWRSAGMSLGYSANLTGPMALPKVYDLDAKGQPLLQARPLTSHTFLLHNLQLSKRFSTRWEAYGGIKNIFDYIQPYTPLTGHNDPNAAVGFSDYFDTVYSYAPLHGREIYLGIRWELPRK